MEILVILDGKIIYTFMDEAKGQKERETRYEDAIAAAVAAGALHENNAQRAFCKLGQP